MARTLIILILATFTGCNYLYNGKGSGAGNDVPSADSSIMRIQIPGSKCYSNITGKDTFNLKVETFPNVVIGQLTYDFFEKDSNGGELEGYFSGDTLIANYSFISEGQRSIRQVIFLIKNGVATEGYGDMEETNGRLVFKDIHKVDFSNGLVLKEVSCIEDHQPAMETAGGSELLFQHKWILSELEGKKLNSRDSNRIPQLAFTPGQINSVKGHTGCNTLSGTFDISGKNGIKFNPLVTTRMACTGENVENEFLAAMSKVESWQVTDTTLKLLMGNKVLLQFGY